jgi:hypothetical protein
MGNHACAALIVLGLTACPAAAQTAYQPPRLPDGKPDLQGIWDFRSLTPLERPANLGDKAVLTAAEAREIEAKASAQTAAQNAPTVRKPVGGLVDGLPYNDFWMDQGAKLVDDRRTSLIIDPPNGRLPPLQSGVEVQVGSGLLDSMPGRRPVRYRNGGIGDDSYEDRALAERCLLGYNEGPPIVPGGYNQNIQIFQTPDHVAILNEMVHDARIVPLDGRPHLARHLRQWLGDSRGHWEGDTLVVDTTNFTDKTASFSPSGSTAIGTGATLHLIERFRRVAGDRLLYEYTVDDPATFTRPFTVRLPMRRGTGLFEYACHEGNHAMVNILRGARAAEQESGR